MEPLPRWVTRVLGLKVEKGQMGGVCVICQEQTSEGFPIRIPQTFVAWWQHLAFGDVLCPYCRWMLKESKFRREDFIVDRSSVKFLKREEVLASLLQPSFKPPFVVILNPSKRKPSWLRAVLARNFNLEKFAVAMEGELLFISCNKLKEATSLTSFLLQHGARRKEIREGNILPSVLGKMQGREERILSEVQRLKGTTEWEISCEYYVRGREEE